MSYFTPDEIFSFLRGSQFPVGLGNDGMMTVTDASGRLPADREPNLATSAAQVIAALRQRVERGIMNYRDQTSMRLDDAPRRAVVDRAEQSLAYLVARTAGQAPETVAQEWRVETDEILGSLV